MKNNNVKKNTATKNEVKTETAVKPSAVTPKDVSMFPVFPVKLHAKTEEFCNEFKTIQLLKKRKMSAKVNVHKALIEQEIKARKQLIEAFKTQLEFLIDDACEKVTNEIA